MAEVQGLSPCISTKRNYFNEGWARTSCRNNVPTGGTRTGNFLRPGCCLLDRQVREPVETDHEHVADAGEAGVAPELQRVSHPRNDERAHAHRDSEQDAVPEDLLGGHVLEAEPHGDAQGDHDAANIPQQAHPRRHAIRELTQPQDETADEGDVEQGRHRGGDAHQREGLGYVVDATHPRNLVGPLVHEIHSHHRKEQLRHPFRCRHRFEQVGDCQVNAWPHISSSGE